MADVLIVARNPCRIVVHDELGTGVPCSKAMVWWISNVES